MGQTFIERQKALKRWGFACECSLCSADGETTSASDTRRIKLQSKRDQAIRAYQDGNAERAIELTNEILQLMEAEELPLLMSEQFENLGRIYWASGDHANGERYARMSLNLLQEQGFIAEWQPSHLKMMLNDYEQDSLAGNSAIL